MDSAAHDFLKRILETPSPSGYERPIQDVVRQYVSDFADTIRTDLHGNVIAAKNPDAPLRVMLAGHCDQIGLLVQYIDDQGYLWIQPIGGWDPQMLVGQHMTVWTQSGPVPGVIARKPIHLLTDEERKQVVKLKDLWIDIGAADKQEAAQLVRVGDPVTFALGYRELRNRIAFAPGMDNKTGLWIAIEALRRADKSKLKCAFYAVSTVQEEVGLRGAKTSAYSIDPQIGIAIDVTHATDCPTVDKKQEGEVSVGKGPVIYRGPNMSPPLFDSLVDTATKNEIPYQLGAISRPTGTDANSLQVNRGGVATALISIPNRYMHSPVEVISLDDLDHSANLLARFAESLSADADFTP